MHLPPLRHMPPRGFKLHKLLGVFLAPDDPLWILDPPTSESASAMTTSPPSTKGRRSDTPPARALQEAPATPSRSRAPATPAAARVAIASFEAEWINPVWHGLGYPVASQRGRIAAQLKQTILNMKALPASVFEISDQAIYRDFGLVLGWRAHHRSWRGFVLAVGLTWGVFLASNAFFASGLFGRLCPRLAQRLRPAAEVGLDAFQVVERYLVAADTAITEEGHQ